MIPTATATTTRSSFRTRHPRYNYYYYYYWCCCCCYSTRLQTMEELKGEEGGLLEAALVGLEEKKKRRQVPLFSVQLLLFEHSNQLDFTPGYTAFADRLEWLTADFVSVVMEVDKLVTHPNFKTFTQPVLGEAMEVRFARTPHPDAPRHTRARAPRGRQQAHRRACARTPRAFFQVSELGEGPDLRPIVEDPDLRPIVEDDARYADLVGFIRAALGDLFRAAEAYCRVFSPFRDMHVENLAFSAAALEAQDLEAFKGALARFTGQLAKMEAMPMCVLLRPTAIATPVARRLLPPARTASLVEGAAPSVRREAAPCLHLFSV